MTTRDYIDTHKYIDRYKRFLEASPTSFHASAAVADALVEAGFSSIDPADEWPSGPGRFYLRDGGAVLAWIQPAQPTTAFAVLGAHTDSPALKLKPHPQSTTADGWGQLEVEVYGGALYNSWLDRELAVAGVLYSADGQGHLVRTGPLARIPQLAIHLDRDQNKGLTLDPQEHLKPVWTVANARADLLSLLCEVHGLVREEIVSADLFCVPTESPALFGDANQFFAAGRQDNLSSVFAGLDALVRLTDDYATRSESAQNESAQSKSALRESALDESSVTPLVAFFDHEEVGSASRTGAAGPLLEMTMRRIALATGADLDRVIPNSFCLSADAGHSIHPNYAQRHDSQTRPVAGQGPVLKLNANQRYASTGSGAAVWEASCAAAGVPSQSFVSRNTVPCGSTIGPITSTRTGLHTVDVGVPMLSMHSAREMTHVDDLVGLSAAIYSYWRNFEVLPLQGRAR